jgi:hypothetical protein
MKTEKIILEKISPLNLFELLELYLEAKTGDKIDLSLKLWSVYNGKLIKELTETDDKQIIDQIESQFTSIELIKHILLSDLDFYLQSIIKKQESDKDDFTFY